MGTGCDKDLKTWLGNNLADNNRIVSEINNQVIKGEVWFEVVRNQLEKLLSVICYCATFFELMIIVYEVDQEPPEEKACGLDF